LSVLGSISFLPFDMLGAEGFEGEDLAFGLGGRVHLLRESFFVPGISGSVMWRSLQRVEFGDICPSGVIQAQVPGSTQTFPACAGSGDHGEFSFDLTDVSARLVASKHLIGLGFTAGFGYDEYDSDVAFGFRGDPLAPGTPA